MTHVNNSKRRRKERQDQAVERAEARAKRSPADQLARLEAHGHGHCAEAERLRA